MIAGDWAAKMYGDCQVMSNMGGNVAASENLFPSPIGNPNFSFFPTPNMPFHPFPSSFNINTPLPKQENGGLGLMMMMRGGKEEMESGSGSEQAVEDKSGNEQDSTDQQPPPDNDPNNNGNDNTIKKKRYHRHTQRQIQEMEALFKECPHPDDKQRMKLSQELGLKPRQVKFWFQNRRTQMKAQQDRSDNIMLRAENESLKNENYRLQAELRNLVCPNCGGPAMLGGIPFQELQLENARLREELEHVRSIASRFSGRPMQVAPPPPPPLVPSPLDLDMNMYSRQFPDSMSTCPQMMPMPLLTDNSSFPEAGLLLMEEEKINVAMELAMSSADVLVKMCQLTKPLWIIDNENGKEMLNLEEHSKMFPWPLNLKQHSCEFRTEASRHSAVVIMNSINLVDAFLDANKWMELFPSIVARAKTVQVISPGVSGPTGSLHLMYAELQVLSPLVPTRETYFLRFCQQNVEEGSWVIVDYPIDSFSDHYEPSFPMYRRRPSGCVIQDMPNGYSTVTWVEHAEVEEKAVHQIFSQLVDSGMAFGAQRWLAVLQRQCERVASLMARNISDLGVIPSPEARMNLMRVAQRMMRIFCLNISTGGGQSWTALSDSCDDTVRITTRKMTEPGQPNGVILSAVSTTLLPYSHNQVFDLLRDEHRRSQVDVLSSGNALQEVAHIANGSHPGNCISLLRINVASNSSQHVELMLQESCTDASGSIVVQSTVDVDSIQLAMSGEDPSCIPLLPQGFVIVPAPAVVNEDVALSTSATALNINQGRLLGSPDDDGQEDSNVGGHGNGGSSNLSSSSGGGGCLLTVGLQVLASTIPSAKLNLSSVTAINNHLCNTVQQIGAALSRGGGVRVTSNAGCTDDVAVADVNIVGSSNASNAIVGSSCSEAAASTSAAAAAASPN